MTRKTLPLLAIAALAASALPAAAQASGATRTVRYHGLVVRVPSAWPVIDVGPSSKVCVRFNRHAVYLGTPGAAESCPPQVAGRTEAILIEPIAGGGIAAAADARSGALTPASNGLAAPAGGSMVRIVERSHHLLVTATWNRDPGLIEAALHLSSLAAAARATNGHRPAAARPASGRVSAASTAAGRGARVAAIAPAAATPGQVYTGLGFDACSAPSSASLAAWAGSSPYQAVGIYIGGLNMACAQTNLTAAWVSAESAAGWHLIPTYVGLQAPGACSGCAAISASQAAAEGAAAAQDAVAQAQALGIGTGNPIYYDMEGYKASTSTTATVLTFLNAWTVQLHSSGYLSGVYSSSSSGITDLVNAQGNPSFTEPDDIWFAHWGTAANASDSYVPSADWANNQRLHQYEGGHDETYNGVEISIDSDYLDGATAAAGSTSAPAAIASVPSLTVTPEASGAIALAPQWSGAAGVASWEIFGGSSATSLTPVQTIPASQALPLVVDDAYSYFSVSALNTTGSVIASSPPVATPASVAIYGNSAFAPTGSVASGAAAAAGGATAAAAGAIITIPVSCLNTPPPCSVQAAIFRGKKRLSHSTVQTIPGMGGTVRLPVMSGVLDALAGGIARNVRVVVTAAGGVKASRTLALIPFSTSGPPPTRSTRPGSDLRILTKSVFVSNGWTGGVLAQCTAPVPCTATTRVTTRAGRLIAAIRTQTIGSGEIAYLGFRLTTAGHTLLRSDGGNQLPARVSVSTVTGTATQDGAAATTAAAGVGATAAVALDSFR